MCGIVGFVNYKDNIYNYRHVIKNMCLLLKRRGPSENNYYLNKNVALGHVGLCSSTSDIGKQPIIEKYSLGEYIIVLNGKIYNYDKLKNLLKKEGFVFNTNNDAEILLKGYIHFGDEVLKHINGAFAFSIWNSYKNELFVARDHLGVKPLYYTVKNNAFVFGSEIKTLFEYPEAEIVLDGQGIGELLGIGPCHTPGVSVFKNIFELKPAHFAIFNQSGLHIHRYWNIESKPYEEDFETTCDNLKGLLQDSINSQLTQDKSFCTFLSGGLDSSIITLFASNYCKENNLPILNTYSVDYLDNDKNFIKSDFQPNSDSYYINLMKKNLETNHHTIMLDTPELADALEDAMIARDMPGMADVDSSLLLFCKNVKQDVGIALTGECADEIFAGYPWFFREDALASNTFPWSIALSERQQMLNQNISNKVNLKEYIDFRYNESLSEVQILESDSKETAQKRKITHLTLNWFMQTLLERSDRMAMYNGFELRVPFCDYRIAEYMWNIPWELKALAGREKGLLRYIMKDLLPAEIVDRKKSPYPKTHNPNYLAKVKNMLSDIMKNPNAPINDLLNRKYILEILETDGKAFSRPWFGQLMTGPQLMAYLCQVNMWLEKYKPRIEI